MKFTELPLSGAYLVEIEPRADERGFFARTFCTTEFEEQGLETCVAQCNVSFNKLGGTVRGMHYSAASAEEMTTGGVLPAAISPSERSAGEIKLVRCTRGAVLDVLIDIRPGSPTYLRHAAVELTGENRSALYIPVGFAHGFQTLEDETEVFYQMSSLYSPGNDRGLRHDDPSLAIAWPLPVAMISARDLAWPLLLPGAP